MTVIERSALLAHPVEQVFDLVADIERYPEFLKGCVGADILKRDDDEVTATLRLSRAGISHGFTTQNRMQRPHRIDLALVDGPFSHFAGHWSFLALGDDACKTTLQLHFELASGIASVAAGKLFDKVALDLVDAIVNRAGQQLEQNT
ncbi:MAG: type II toxin-antitoxin system RatA family toxin [Halieaceae bacterium]|jgi:ribosome-associated toxin RatA of RatAB toxin-antitoxin module|nr:type II toxin-antitoxin system RatA family toxin [Halieaceae bacterium]|tara:strand:- start:32 stop:472 length:441 start_codon:yes stop_codon:yes gene_type:complete